MKLSYIISHPAALCLAYYRCLPKPAANRPEYFLLPSFLAGSRLLSPFSVSMEYGDYAFEKILTPSDVKLYGRFAVPRGMAAMMPRGDPKDDIPINVLERYEDWEHVYHFKLSIRSGTSEKPVFQAREWGDFIRLREPRQGDLIRFWHEVNETKGTQYRIALLKIYL